MGSLDDAAALATLRLRMVDLQLRQRGIADERILAAMSRVPRHEFASAKYRDQAYEDHPLPIGEGQTISQPYMVALMLEALTLSPTDNVLEVGTGSGYVTALLAELADKIVSIERHPTLAEQARIVLSDLGYRNVKIITGDGTLGYRETAPYDAIIVSAAAPQLPRYLLEQLADGGRMIIPVGREDTQQLQLVEKREGQAHITLRELCRFVPLVSDAA
ncbi:MAG TPA: protein-L-isoaspartate(D-aspartate) O-methyltransferase [Candidatus Acidoferrales bacterium]|nr:protein-L-isoaspartate(D-aspartate) O-methyltransferase [Candidatus Acidoferrales bacterium]